MKLNRKDYRKIAKKHGITVREVKRDMQEVINSAYENPNFYANCVPRESDIPTIDEFVVYMVNRINILNKLQEDDLKIK